MTPARGARVLLGTLLVAALMGAGSPSAGAASRAGFAVAASTGEVTVDMNQAAVNTTIGHRFGLDSTVRNDGSQGATGLVAHLNIVSLDPSVYVDPEDWSSERTQFLQPVAGGGESPLHWKLQAVNDGRFVVYVALYDNRDGSLVSSAHPVRLKVAAQSTLNAGGVLPVAIGLPALLLGLLLAIIARRRRLS